VRNRVLVLLIFLLVAAGLAVAQQPDCVIPISLTAVGQATPNLSCGHNTLGIYEWHLIYFNDGFTGPFSLVVESAPDAAGAPGAWVTFVGTVNTGINPNTSIVYADTILTGYNPWNRVRLAAAGGVGTVTGAMYGCRWPGCAVPPPSSASGCPGTALVPCVVDGPTAAGSPPTTPPVLVAGQDGINIQTIKTDTNGDPTVVGPTAAGSPPATAPVQVGGTDGANVREVSTDTTGRVNVNALGVQPANVTATWTSATGLNTALAVSTVGYSNVALSYVTTGVITGGVVTFETTQDGTNWFAMGVAPINGTSSLPSTWALFVTPSQAWQMFVGGFSQFRIRLSAVIVGAGSVAVIITPTTAATEFAAVVGQSSAPNLQAQVQGMVSNKGVVGTPAVLVSGWDGSLARLLLYCPFQAVISTSAAKTTIIPLSGVKQTYICDIQLSNASGVNIQFWSGTNVSGPCDTTPVAMTGNFQNWLSGGPGFSSNAPLTGVVGKDICLFQSGTVDIEGVVLYAQF
jgi:hypothetical protein